MRVSLGDAIQIIINSIEQGDMQSYVNVYKLLEALINKAKEKDMVDLEVIAAKVREDVAKLEKVQTNYEKIISMGIEELARFLIDIHEPDEDTLQIRISTGREYKEVYSEKELLKWLRQEAR